MALLDTCTNGTVSYNVHVGIKKVVNKTVGQ